MNKLKSALLILATILSAAPAFAQARTYQKTLGGKPKSTLTISESKSGDNYIAKITEGSKVEIHTMDASRKTIAFQIIDKSNGTDAKVTLQDGIYTFTGQFKGKKIDRTEKTNGYPWYQNPKINGVKFFKGKKGFKFECIRPTEFDRFTLKSEDKGTQTIDGMTVTQILNSNTGPFAGAWTASYCFDVNTGLFVLYKSVEGAPGTPETKIIIKQ